MVGGWVVLFYPLPKRGDRIKQVLKGDDGFLDHVYFVYQSSSFWLLQQDTDGKTN